MPDWAEDEIDEEFYDDERHMLAVLDAILNRSKTKTWFLKMESVIPTRPS